MTAGIMGCRSSVSNRCPPLAASSRPKCWAKHGPAGANPAVSPARRNFGGGGVVTIGMGPVKPHGGRGAAEFLDQGGERLEMGDRRWIFERWRRRHMDDSRGGYHRFDEPERQHDRHRHLLEGAGDIFDVD